MRCPCCGYKNLAGAGWCDECGMSLAQEDVPVARAGSGVERHLCEATVDDLDPVQRAPLEADSPITDAISRMRDEKVCSLLVADQEGRLVGILTVRDLIRTVLGGEEGLNTALVRDVMTPDPETLKPGHLLAYALHRMAVGDYRHLPLTSEDGRPVGLISSRHIIRYIVDAVGVCA